MRYVCPICGYVYDEERKTVSMSRYFDSLGTTEYECLDEFNTDYDEDGLEFIGASNLTYNLSDTEENKFADIEEEVLNMFSIKEYASMSDAQKDIANMEEREKMTTVFHFTDDPFGDAWGYCTKSEDEEGNSRFSITPFGNFMHLTRDGSDNGVTLNMVPAATRHVEFEIRVYFVPGISIDQYTQKIAFSMPSSTNDNEYSENKALEEYVSVENYLENGNEPTKKEEAERMELYFITGKTHDIEYDKVVERTVSFLNCSNEYEGGSFRFEGGRADKSIGQFHVRNKLVENKEQVVIKFLADDLPDPKKIFVFRNKRFLCDKIEFEINDNGIDRLMTGYFYELVS